MAPNTKIILEAVAEVQAAKAKILELEATVKQLQATIGSPTGKKEFEVQTAKAVSELVKLETEMSNLAQKTEKAQEAVAQAESKGAAATEKASQRAIQAILRRDIAQEQAKNKQAFRLAQTAAAAENASRREIEAAHRAAIAYDQKRDKLIAAEAAQNKFAASAQLAARAIQAFAASLVVQKIKEFTDAIISSAAAFESYRNTIIAAVGSSEVADATIEHLRTTANTFGVSFETLLQRFGRFKVAADSVGFSVKQTETIFDGFVAVSRALGNTNEQTERTFVALEQIMSKGVVQSEELKQQLGDSLVGAYNKLGKAMGLTGLEFEKQLKTNQILAQKAIPDLLDAYFELAGPAIQKNLNSLNAEIERTKNTLFDAKVVAGNAASGEFKDLLQVLRAIGTDGALSFENIGRAAGGLLGTLGEVIAALDSLLRLDFGDTLTLGLIQVIRLLGNFRDIAFSIAEDVGPVMARIFGKSEEAIQKSTEALKAQRLEARRNTEDLIAQLHLQTNAYQSAAEAQEALQEEAANQVKKLQEEIQVLKEKGLADDLARGHVATKAELAELKKRENAFEQFFAKIADLSQKQPKVQLPDVQAPTGGGVQSLVSPQAIAEVDSAKKKVQELTVALSKLIAERESFQDGGFVKPEQLNRVNELSQSIARARQELKDASDEAARTQLQAVFDANAAAAKKLSTEMAEFSTKVKAALTDLVRDNDAFRDSFTRLDEGSQIAVESLVANLERAANAGRVTQADFQNFLSGVASIFGQAGIIGQQFAVGLQASFGQTQTSVSGLLAGLAEIGPAALAGAAGVTEAGAAVVASSEQQKIAVQETGRVTTEAFLKQADDAKASAAGVAAAGVQVVASVGEANQKIVSEVAAGQAAILDSTGKAVEEASNVIITKLDETTTVIDSAADSAGAAQARMVAAVTTGVGQSVAAITNTIDFASGKIDDFGGMVETIGERGERAFSIVGEAAVKAGSEVENTINVATDAAGKLTLSNEKIEQAGDAAVAAFNEAKAKAGETATEVGKVDTAVKGAKTSSEGLAKAAADTKKSTEATPAAIDKMAVSIESASTKMAILKTDFQECLSLCLQIEQCMNRIAQ